MSVSVNTKYVAVANSLLNLDDSDLNAKTKIMKYDRAALMYLLASEIIILSRDRRQSILESAIASSEKSFAAAGLGIKEYQALVASGPSPDELDWLEREDPFSVLVQRKVEAAAQLVCLQPTAADQYRSEIEKAVSLLSEGHIRKHRVLDQEMLSRVGEASKDDVCVIR